jgi:hypothetical protein
MRRNAMDLVLEDQLRAFQVDRGLTGLRREQAFETFATFCILGLHYEESDDGFEPDDARVGGAGDLGIDAVVVEINDKICTTVEDVRKAVGRAPRIRAKFVVVQAKAQNIFDPDTLTKLGEALFQVFRTQPMAAVRTSKKIKALRECVDLVYAHGRKLVGRPELSAYYAAGGSVPKDGTAAKCAEVVARIEALERLEPVRLRLIGTDELIELYRRTSDAVSASVKMENRVTLPPIPGVRQAFIGVLRAKDIVEDLLTNPAGAIRSELFNENVRSFLGYGEADEDDQGDSVNSQIRDTVRGEVQQKFSVLNNGITIVARSLGVVGHELRMRDFHIVNGCQTCYVLFDDAGKLDEGTYVPAKVIETADEALISEIVSAANRQNAVAPGDLVAREKLQRDIEDHFKVRPVSGRLYYERRPGQYENEDVEKTRIITRPQLMKAYAAMYLDEAHRVTRLSEVVASRGDELFRPRDTPLPYYASASAYYRVEWLLRNAYIPAAYSQARFHFVAGFKLYVLGPDRLPDAPRALKTACEELLDVLWSTDRAQDVGQALGSALLFALNEEGLVGQRLGEVVRTARFRRAMANAVLALRS